MKKIFMIFAILFIAVTVNAQWYLGGEFGLQVRNDRLKLEDDKELSKNDVTGSFIVAPNFGYCISDKLAVGLRVGVGLPQFRISGTKEKDHYNKVGWAFYPYVRYAVFTHKRFSVVLEGSLGVGGEHQISKVENEKPVKGSTTINVRVLNIAPVLDFKLTDHWYLYTALRFLEIGYDIGITKPNPDVKTVSTSHNFRFIVNADNVLSLTNLTIGAYYKF